MISFMNAHDKNRKHSKNGCEKKTVLVLFNILQNYVNG